MVRPRSDDRAVPYPSRRWNVSRLESADVLHGRAFDVAVPIGTEPLFRGKESSLDRRSSWWLTMMARLKPGQSVDSGTAALRGVQDQIRDATLPQDWRPSDVESYLKEKFTLVPAGAGNSQLRQRYERPGPVAAGLFMRTFS